MTPAELQARVLYRDALMLVIDKPAGIAVHAGPGRGDNLERHFDALRFGLPRPPGLAHRLDRETSGCLVLGRHPKALRKLGKLFSAGLVEKTYWAVVAGTPPGGEGVIDLPLLKDTARGRWYMKGDPSGQAAVTEWRLLGSGGGLSWLECRPRTGRTHQIRVHCASLGCPILGDATYGGPADRPMHLHARAVVLPLYPSRDAIAVTAPPPAHMRDALIACGFAGDAVTSPAPPV